MEPMNLFLTLNHKFYARSLVLFIYYIFLLHQYLNLSTTRLIKYLQKKEGETLWINFSTKCKQTFFLLPPKFQDLLEIAFWVLFQLVVLNIQQLNFRQHLRVAIKVKLHKAKLFLFVLTTIWSELKVGNKTIVSIYRVFHRIHCRKYTSIDLRMSKTKVKIFLTKLLLNCLQLIQTMRKTCRMLMIFSWKLKK